MSSPAVVNYIIIGANGFIGRNLLAHLADKSVIAIGRSAQHAPIGNEKYYSVLEHSLDYIAGTLAGMVNIVIDLSYTSVSNAKVNDPGSDFSDNIELVIENLKFARTIAAEKYLYISTGGAVYGQTNAIRIDEGHTTNPISHYGIIKLASEKYVQMFCSENKLNYNIIRPSNVYGPGQIPFRGQGIIATALGAGIRKSPITIYGKGDNIRDYIYVTDFCEWVLALCHKGQNGEVYNAGSGTGYSIFEIITMVQNILSGRQYDLVLQYLPDRPFDVKKNVLDNTRIVEATGIGPATDLKPGVERTCEWVERFMVTGRMSMPLGK